MHAVGDLDGGLRDGGRAGGARAQHVGQEGPVALGVDRRVDADEAAAVAVVVLEGRLLGVCEDVA